MQYQNTSLSHPGGYTAANAFVGERVTRDGSTYKSEKQIFMRTTGDIGFAPVDMAVGPDGDLFIAIGGRGTRGSVFRVHYTGKVTPLPGAGDVGRRQVDAQQVEAGLRDRLTENPATAAEIDHQARRQPAAPQQAKEERGGVPRRVAEAGVVNVGQVVGVGVVHGHFTAAARAASAEGNWNT